MIVAAEAGKDPVLMQAPLHHIEEIVPSVDGPLRPRARHRQALRRRNRRTPRHLPRLAYRSFAVHPDSSADYATAGELLLRLDGTTLATTVEEKRLPRTAQVAVDPDGKSVYVSSVTAAGWPRPNCQAG
ncbi:hypothetical protein CP980_04875 [Streptomyces vinaceus]|uniref:YncE family protein n=1 Tax=Streptomyces vinaceus TaxID=1960 RepID=A0A5J6J4B2_STRVI|nr:hypothetical protein [Streptomyces vinaceus]QEV44491.1 hypothetical protein CP980_04875 [Streptomyces vinaceus]GHE26565.1 hypothetical protein GCM10017778_04900 [Streptomyces vinaceus]